MKIVDSTRFSPTSFKSDLDSKLKLAIAVPVLAFIGAIVQVWFDVPLGVVRGSVVIAWLMLFVLDSAALRYKLAPSGYVRLIAGTYRNIVDRFGQNGSGPRAKTHTA